MSKFSLKTLFGFVAVQILALIFFSGCGTVKMQTFAKSSNSIFFKEISSKKSVFLINKNSSGVDNNIGQMVQSQLMSKGYSFVSDANDAKYILRINTLNLNAGQEQTAVAAVGAGAVTGAVVGGAAKKSLKAGAVTGLAAGAAAGLFALATEDGTVKMQADVFITEKLEDEKKVDYTTRIFTEATQMHLTAQEAQPILEEKIAAKISGIFL